METKLLLDVYPNDSQIPFDDITSQGPDKNTDFVDDEEFSDLKTILGTNNETNHTELPIDMQFNDGHVLSIITYSILMVISAFGNISVLKTILRSRSRSRLNRINLFLLHLAIADLMVTFLMMPIEIGWAATVSWKAGDLMCRTMSFFRVFGLFLSGFIIVCISFDRYFAVLKPLTISENQRRSKLMLFGAWLGSFACSLPQSIIFHVERHPNITWFEQCVTFNFFPSEIAEMAYNIFGQFFLYGFPLSTIIFCYSRILCEIFQVNNANNHELRRSNMGALGRAKIHTLKMTLVIVTTFFLCWTPYNVICIWYWIDRSSAGQVDQKIQKALFLFACTNSCVNPMVYGYFHNRSRSHSTQPRVLVVHNHFCTERRNNTTNKITIRWRPKCHCLRTGAPSSGENSFCERQVLKTNQDRKNDGMQYSNHATRSNIGKEPKQIENSCADSNYSKRSNRLLDVKHEQMMKIISNNAKKYCVHGHIQPNKKCHHCMYNQMNNIRFSAYTKAYNSAENDTGGSQSPVSGKTSGPNKSQLLANKAGEAGHVPRLSTSDKKCFPGENKQSFPLAGLNTGSYSKSFKKLNECVVRTGSSCNGYSFDEDEENNKLMEIQL